MRIPLVIACLLIGALPAQDQSEHRAVVSSFEQHIRDFMDSYKTDKRDRVTLLGGGWVRERFEPEAEYKIDVQATNSLITPYTGYCEFSLVRHYTRFHENKNDAEKDEDFVQSETVKHKHTYAFQDDKWTVKMRQNYWAEEKEWEDCDEIISTGENKGARDIFGCWEKDWR
jgi:hypothetical protein